MSETMASNSVKLAIDLEIFQDHYHREKRFTVAPEGYTMNLMEDCHLKAGICDRGMIQSQFFHKRMSANVTIGLGKRPIDHATIARVIVVEAYSLDNDDQPKAVVFEADPMPASGVLPARNPRNLIVRLNEVMTEELAYALQLSAGLFKVLRATDSIDRSGLVNAANVSAFIQSKYFGLILGYIAKDPKKSFDELFREIDPRFSLLLDCARGIGYCPKAIAHAEGDAPAYDPETVQGLSGPIGTDNKTWYLVLPHVMHQHTGRGVREKLRKVVGYTDHSLIINGMIIDQDWLNDPGSLTRLLAGDRRSTAVWGEFCKELLGEHWPDGGMLHIPVNRYYPVYLMSDPLWISDGIDLVNGKSPPVRVGPNEYNQVLMAMND